MSYILRLLIDLDVSVGYAIWKQRGVTISGQTGRALRFPNPPLWARWLGAFLDWISPGHCALARLDDMAALQESINYLRDTP